MPSDPDSAAIEGLRRIQEQTHEEERAARKPEPTGEAEPSTLDDRLKKVFNRLGFKDGVAAGPPDEEFQRREREREARRQKEQAAARFAAIAKDLGPRYSTDRCSLITFHAPDPRQRAALDQVTAIYNTLADRIHQGQSVIFFGANGTGKDHLQAVLLYQAVRLGFPCRKINGPEMYRTVRDRIGNQESETKLLDKLAEPNVLAISDPIPPAGDLSAYRLEFLYSLVEKRYCALTPTWMTLNARDAQEAEEALSVQVWDRLEEGAELIPCFWPSHRQAAKKPNSPLRIAE
jgi:DNA replication protein DnaC